MAKKTETKSKPTKPNTLSPKQESKKEFQRLFLECYLGWHDPEGFGNATFSYLFAQGHDTDTIRELSKPFLVEDQEIIKAEDVETGEVSTERIMRKVYHPFYKTAKTGGWRMLTNADIRKLKVSMLNDYYKTKGSSRNRHIELALQNKNLVVARQANADILKIQGELEDRATVDIPQLVELTEKIGGILKVKK